jgi:adenylylsulfate kinase-like enzyme
VLTEFKKLRAVWEVIEMIQKQKDNHGVIWITGFSSAGKTTVGRKVEKLLRNEGVNTILLDGDDLRSILDGHWGYEREDRVELAHVYFRLCSHLAAQGYTVVISAVAMYTEVREWLLENVPGFLEVYLDVPDAERKERDEKSKQVYKRVGDVSKMYDMPDDQVFRIKNFGDQTPDDSAKQIMTKYLELSVSDVDFRRQGHWSDYYSSGSAPAKPSPFAESVNGSIARGSKLIEIGCGNGRDSFFFAREGHKVKALDPSESAIEACRAADAGGAISYYQGTLPGIAETLPNDFDVAYSRFVIHAMPLVEEVRTLEAVAGVLSKGGRFYVECRSINDPMAREGEVISPTERIHGHYRRFIIKEELEERLETVGFKVIESIESKGLAVHGDDDPMIIRVVAEYVE